MRSPFCSSVCSATWRKPNIPIPGTEVAGRVTAVGPDVTRFQPLDAVYGDISECGFGGFAEYVCVPETALTLMPDGMTFTEAAAIPHAATLAVQGLTDIGQLQPGQKRTDQWPNHHSGR
jgi:NADPH:quinone reductase-like Zn-dependent oxidoreductase